ncbi:MAG: penicillin acylase family protein [Moraxellaceae bacterium]|nr:penicillin acylase family protein [Moraxellaceae bacterium]
MALHSLRAVSLVLVASLSACAVVDLPLRKTVARTEGEVRLAGLADTVVIARDALGVPRIEAQNDDDLAFGLGYAMAADRIAQMVTYSLTAQGRMSEMAGPVTRDLDIYMRTLGLRRISERQLAMASPRLKRTLERFSAGVNAWVFAHKERLPLDFKMSGYTPEPWAPVNSMDIFTLLNLGLSLNLHEEIAFLNLAAKVGPEKAAWLLPSYPDEPIAQDEAGKLAGVPFNELLSLTAPQVALQQQLKDLFLPLRQAASNNWALAPELTQGRAVILANDTHLMLEHPPVWMLVQLAAPGYHAGGIAVAGIPGIVAGYNGHVAWGMTMVMGDSQDVFVEKLKAEEGRTLYEHKGEWKPVVQREEILRIKGLPDETFTVQETVHGPLLGAALRGVRVNDIMPPVLHSGSGSGWGLAVQTSSQLADRSMERFLQLGQAQSFNAAQLALDGIGFIHLNVLFADAQNIGWQVTGSYPKRLAGRGYLPSPGWTGAYDWDGYVPYDELPGDINPPERFLATANHRTVMPGAGPQLTGSWYAPERHERIAAQLQVHERHTLGTTTELQNDVQDGAALKLREQLKRMTPVLRERIAQLPANSREQAEKALRLLSRFDGVMDATDAPGAALYGIFLDTLTRETFADELGPRDGVAWQSFLLANAISYSAQQDHMLGRDDSPFWDDIRTSGQQEDKADIFARTLARSWISAESELGNDALKWQWGKLHTYHWESPATKMKPFLPFTQAKAVGALSGYLDRGPFPAPGSTNTVNVAGYTIGDGYKVWNVPAMRMIVDFSQTEPLHLINAGGQSGNPASPHYADGIELYLSGRNRRMALHDPEQVKTQFSRKLVLRPAE